MPTESYSGYLKVNDEKQLHYIFIESEHEPSTDPILLWFNGGPGCSSLLAFIQEHGPWVIEDEASEVTRNPYPWNANASIIYLESPAGVGWSPYLVDKEDMIYNDMIQSEDAYAALKAWYEKFPEYGPKGSNNSLFISGESYGGIYTPYLAWQIYQHNVDAKQWDGFTDDFQINLGGFIVGNGATDWDYDVMPVFPELVKYFNLIPESVYANWTEHQCIIFFNGTVGFNASRGSVSECYAIWQDILDNTASLNWYDLYRKNFTVGPGTTDFWGQPLEDRRYGKTVLKDGREMTYKRGCSFNDYVGRWAKHHPHIQAIEQGLADDNLMIGEDIADYLNKQEIKDILHIKDEMYKNNNSVWEACNGYINGQWHIQNEASLWIYRVMKHQSNIKMLFFSGDTDGAVPALGTRKWIEKLDWEIKDPWAAWIHEGQIQGYIEHYRGHFSFATVRGVGHMAPQWARAPMQFLITQFIHDLPIPTRKPDEADPDLIQF